MVRRAKPATEPEDTAGAAAPEVAVADPAPAAEWVARTSLHGWERNPRKNDATVPIVADSIRRFGFGAPLVCRRENRQILAGHTRAAACDLLARRWEKATSREQATWHPDAIRVATKGELVARFIDIDQHDAQLLAIADNKVGERSSWDDGLLAAVLADLDAAGADLVDGTGFTDEDVKKLLEGGEAEGGGTGKDPGEDRYKSQYGVIVLCGDEAEQQRVYEQLKGEGFDCKVVVT